MSESKKLRLEDLKLGMMVNNMQLSNIFNTYIILTESNISDNGQYITGKIAWIGDKLNSESDKLNKISNTACIFNTDDTCDGEVYYEE